MGDPMDVDSDAVDLPTAAGTRRRAVGRRLYTIDNMRRLVKDEAITFFNANIENFLSDWITVLEQTNLPSNIASSDPYVITVFKRLDSMIDAGESIR
ncbi:hypothetical protein F5883DRAFT_591952 [Diaporthe sp. PMI_573]|nr:hypothetical protein F5883DRAFT_591952 [Diaporthaceae sp. PMI_573]